MNIDYTTLRFGEIDIESGDFYINENCDFSESGEIHGCDC